MSDITALPVNTLIQADDKVFRVIYYAPNFGYKLVDAKSEDNYAMGLDEDIVHSNIDAGIWKLLHN